MRPVRSRPYKSSETLARSKAGTLIIPMYIFLSRLGRAPPRNLSPAIKSPESLRSSNTFRATTAPKQSSHLVVRPKTSSSHRTWSRLHNHPSKLQQHQILRNLNKTAVSWNRSVHFVVKSSSSTHSPLNQCCVLPIFKKTLHARSRSQHKARRAHNPKIAFHLQNTISSEHSFINNFEEHQSMKTFLLLSLLRRVLLLLCQAQITHQASKSKQRLIPSCYSEKALHNSTCQNQAMKQGYM